MSFFKHLSAGAARTLGLAAASAPDDEDEEGAAPDAAPEPNDDGDEDAGNGEDGGEGAGNADDAGSDEGAGTTEQPSSASAGQNGRFNMAAMQEAVEAARLQGAEAANKRMSAVFASKEAKKDPATAAFLLSTSSASAKDIVAHMKSSPRLAAGIPDTSLDLGASGHDGSDEGASEDEVDAGWDKSRASVSDTFGVGMEAPQAAPAAGGVTTSVPLPPTGY